MGNVFKSEIRNSSRMIVSVLLRSVYNKLHAILYGRGG